MTLSIDSIIYPKRHHLTGNNKPLALVVHSPYCFSDNATKFQLNMEEVRNQGFGILNKKQITFDQDEKQLTNSIKPIIESKTGNKSISLIFYSHGLPGFLFGDRETFEAEAKGIRQFVSFVNLLESRINKKIDNIILNACYSASELYNPKLKKYFYSPARLLSILLPGKKVVGFVGEHAGATVTHIYKKENQNFSEIKLKPHLAAMLFEDGQEIIKPDEPLYCLGYMLPNSIKNEISFHGEFFESILQQNQQGELILPQIKLIANIKEDMTNSCSVKNSKTSKVLSLSKVNIS
ncbi:hypothetical protein [Legionella londiniensis]|uniref:Uncharacterized protein n=1 Tax=Legionella londiniensis TaxID=45068 RepID=A0A0W0VKV9_9GAMM|nr:hypothetical protein [Legionella londiniensis]KTD20736.1 hypothetical protein Llon_1622 [Legionella londiniensis]STX92791.1 Uncharacterised protein [Legionella londiniensis]